MVVEMVAGEATIDLIWDTMLDIDLVYNCGSKGKPLKTISPVYHVAEDILLRWEVSS